MTVAQVVGVAVGVLALLAGLWQLIRAIYRGVSLIEHLVERVAGLEKTLSNGIRSDVRTAADQAREARQLAAEAARVASIAEQRAREGRDNIAASIGHLRAEVDVLTNVVVADTAHIWETLRGAGLDRRTAGDDD